MTRTVSRRYIVKGYSGSPGWSGCTWANACATLEAAQALFTKKMMAFDSGSANADVILLIDRHERLVLGSVGTDKPEKVADWFGW